MPIKLNRAKSNQQFCSRVSRVGLIFKGYWDLLLETFFILLIPLHNVPSATSWNHGLALYKTQQQERKRCRHQRNLQPRSIRILAEQLHSYIALQLLAVLSLHIWFDKNVSQVERISSLLLFEPLLKVYEVQTLHYHF